MKKYFKLFLGILLLLLAFSKGFFIGMQKDTSLVTMISVFLIYLYYELLLKSKNKLRFIYLLIAFIEVLSFTINLNVFNYISGFLLLVLAVVEFFSLHIEKRGTKNIYKVGKVIFSFLAIISVVVLIFGIHSKPSNSFISPNLKEVTLKENNLDSEEIMLQNIEIMNSFGSRITGSEGHNEFINWLKSEITAMGLEVHTNKYSFEQWKEKTSELSIDGEKIEVSSAYPYSGVTDKNGVTGELVYIKNNDYKSAKGKIAVVEIDNTKKLPLPLIMNKLDSFPLDNNVVSSDGDVVLSSTLQTPNLIKLKDLGVKAVVLVWKGVSGEKIKDQYLPFTTDYAGIPALFVNETEGEKVINYSNTKSTATLTLEANTQSDAKTESFYVMLEGKNKDETIIINSHTDGVNVVEENGAVAMLSMLKYLKDEPLDKNIVFAFVTGHFRLPVFKGSSQATSTWLNDNKELWDGKNDHKKAVSAITVEHLGSLEWKDDENGVYKPTGNIQIEYTYVNNPIMLEVWKEAIKDRENTKTVFLHGHNKFEFGESQPLFEENIPVIGFIPMPDYLLTNSNNREMDKFDITLMHNQVSSLLKAALILDDLPKEQLGIGDSYSYFWGNTK
ncbi:hypothetical protein [Clostridium intestinale]|uniref:hypothetical protein n=1 Tax=Clostridium intestinale TaxID=36845 RepID=UPI0028E1D614|nr:hypothetical protein [Clostridium intestinale]